ncbi:hypothetical protein LX32DRAFT_257060 [Colletotrichum zoysiae]|uniref:Uncharacterized protein n=1 Tax=Colletotrichum zoysiae TaxID=1216348 RepID=A0AAD9HP87_9PEZI|nr:hypothetical protein LX32DRAFT_257060 [Colletotrichum zoysiae]
MSSLPPPLPLYDCVASEDISRSFLTVPVVYVYEPVCACACASFVLGQAELSGVHRRRGAAIRACVPGGVTTGRDGMGGAFWCLMLSCLESEPFPEEVGGGYYVERRGAKGPKGIDRKGSTAIHSQSAWDRKGRRTLDKKRGFMPPAPPSPHLLWNEPSFCAWNQRWSSTVCDASPTPWICQVERLRARKEGKGGGFWSSSSPRFQVPDSLETGHHLMKQN